MSYSGGSSHSCDLRTSRQAHDECRARSVIVVMTKNFARVLAHNAIADTQAKSGSLAHLFGGKERVKDALRMQDAMTVVAERDFRELAAKRCHDLNPGRPSGFPYCVISIIDDVQEYLLQLVRIANNLGQIAVKVLDDFNSMA